MFWWNPFFCWHSVDIWPDPLSGMGPYYCWVISRAEYFCVHPCPPLIYLSSFDELSFSVVSISPIGILSTMGDTFLDFRLLRIVKITSWLQAWYTYSIGVVWKVNNLCIQVFLLTSQNRQECLQVHSIRSIYLNFTSIDGLKLKFISEPGTNHDVGTP